MRPWAERARGSEGDARDHRDWAPRLAEPSLSWTVPVGFAGTTCAVRITIPPSPRGKGTWTTLSAVVVAVAPGAGVGVGVDDRLGVGVGSALTT